MSDYAWSPEQVDAQLREIRTILERGLQKFKIEESREPGTRPEKPVGVIHGQPHKQRHSNTSKRKWALDIFVRDGQPYGRIIEDDDVIICEVVGAIDVCGNDENGHLLSAAPDLFMALSALAEAYVNGIDPNSTKGRAKLKQAEEAVAKAFGNPVSEATQ